MFFNDDEIQLVNVYTGDHIGNFVGGSTKGGIEIILERVGNSASMEVARLNEHVLTISSALGSTNAEKFNHYHEKEQILNYLDPCAFFGMMQYGEDELTIPSTDISIFSLVDLIKKFKNRNRIYLDIRSEYDNSFNYYLSYGEEIGMTFNVLSPPPSLPTQNYYSSNISSGTNYGTWPIFIIESQPVIDLTDDGLGGRIMVELMDPNDCLEGIYLLEGRFNNEIAQSFNLNDGGDMLIELSSWVYADLGINLFGPGYILLKTIYNRNSSFQGLFTPSTSTIDHLFPINKLNLGIHWLPNDVVMKVYHNGSVIQHIDFPEYFKEVYAGFLGLAKDGHSYTFFTYPNEDYGFKKDARIMTNFSPITSRTKQGEDFFNVVHKRTQNVSFETREIPYADTTVPVLKAVRNIKTSLGENFDPNYLNAIQITHIEYDTIAGIISNSTLLGQYSIYLSTKNSEARLQELPGYQFRSVQLVLSGLCYVPGSSDAELEKGIVETGIYIQTIISKD